MENYYILDDINNCTSNNHCWIDGSLIFDEDECDIKEKSLKMNKKIFGSLNKLKNGRKHKKGKFNKKK